MSVKEDPSPKFKVNQMVRLRLDPSVTGVVLEILLDETAVLYRVFISSNDQRYVKEEDLLPMAPATDGDAITVFDRGADALRREVLLVKLNSPFGESLYSLRASRVEFHVYQFKPVLKLLANPDQRLLIADEVGLGKTIEAGIILTELRARTELDRVLIVVPSGLRQKWHDELRGRFDETFEIMDSARFGRFLDEYAKHGETTRLRAIVSIDMIRRADFLATLGEDQIQFDLVIIDEAHNCRNPATRSHELATVLSENADAMLLLTATPLHLGNEDLFHLMQILQPGEFDDFSNFEYRIMPNRILNSASRAISAGNHRKARDLLRRLLPPAFGAQYAHSTHLQETLAILEPEIIVPDAAIRCQRLLLELNGLAHVFTRTRKREVSTSAPLREARVLKHRYSPEELFLYEGVSRLVRAEWKQSGQADPIGFRLVTRERQAASCLPAFASKYLESGRSLDLDAEEIDVLGSLGIDLADSPKGESWDLPARLRSVAARLIDGSIPDSKFDQFQVALGRIFSEVPDARVMVFSFFLDTLKYLEKRLRALGLGVFLIDGNVPIEKRLAVIASFRDSSGPAVLLSSEVGSEGLDFQFCHILFNYDLPWNPMKVEQRIGRIDRFGQLSPAVWIYSLVAEDTVEDRILLRLYQRIKIFEETVGDVEVILGEEMGNMTRALFTRDLSEAQQIELSDRIARSVLRRKQELDEFEEHKMEFLGQDAIFESDIRAALASGRYVAPAEVKALVVTFAERISGTPRLEQDQDDESCVFTPDRQLAEYLRSRLVGPEYSDEVSRNFRVRLHPMSPVPVTFTDSLAYDRRLLEYLNIAHPLCRLAAAYWTALDRGEYPVVSATLETNTAGSGDFYAFLFSLRIEALRSQERLVALVVDAYSFEVKTQLGEQLLSLLQTSGGRSDRSPAAFPATGIENAKRIALRTVARLRDETENEQRRMNNGLVEMRLASLNQTFESKRRLYTRYRDTATEPRIRRMRQGQLENLEARHRADGAKVEARRSVSVTFSLKLLALLSIRQATTGDRKVPEGRLDAGEAGASWSPRPGTQYIYDRKCPHGVSLIQLCAICNPEEFRRMTGID